MSNDKIRANAIQRLTLGLAHGKPVLGEIVIVDRRLVHRLATLETIAQAVVKRGPLQRDERGGWECIWCGAGGAGKPIRHSDECAYELARELPPLSGT